MADQPNALRAQLLPKAGADVSAPWDNPLQRLHSCARLGIRMHMDEADVRMAASLLMEASDALSAQPKPPPGVDRDAVMALARRFHADSHGLPDGWQDWADEFSRDLRSIAAQAPAAECWCETCRPRTLSDMRFIVCPDCGNKRCPKATDHRNACTNSNEVGQKGSSWENVKPAADAGGVVVDEAMVQRAVAAYEAVAESEGFFYKNRVPLTGRLRAAIEAALRQREEGA